MESTPLFPTPSQAFRHGLCFALVLLALSLGGKAQAQFTETNLSNQNPALLVIDLMGPGVSASNVTYQGNGASAGSFSGGTPVVGFDSGIVLSTGTAAGVTASAGTTLSTCNGLGGDTDLAALSGNPVTNLFDATVLEFDFIPTSSTISFSYVFASEEYNHYVGSSYNDVFGFFVNGANVALVPGTSTQVSINTVNDCSNPAYFIDNIGSPQGGSCAVVKPSANLPTAMTGLTTVLTANALVNPGVVNHIKLAIADVGDCRNDSDVFIQANSFTSPPTDTPTPCMAGGFTCTPTDTPTATYTMTPCGWPGPLCTLTVTSTNTFTGTITPTGTSTPTLSSTTTANIRPSNTPTPTRTPTFTYTPTSTPTSTSTFTPTDSSTPCGWPGNTCTFTPTITSTPTFANVDIFYVDKNLFSPANDKGVSITVNSSQFPGHYSLRIYNSAGEHIKTLDDRTITTYFNQGYFWDGTNKNGDACASGEYIFYLIEPYSRKIKKVLLVR